MNSQQRRKERRKFPYEVSMQTRTWEGYAMVTEWLEEAELIGEVRGTGPIYNFSNEKDAIIFRLTFTPRE